MAENIASKRKKKNYQQGKKKEKPTVPHTHKPSDMSHEEWQTILRKQIAEQEVFKIKNIGEQPVYSDYTVFSEKSKNAYKVALRSKDNSANYCACPDFKTNQLGTCKHIEAVWLDLKKKRGIKKLIDEVPALSYTSMYVSYIGKRKIKLRIGIENNAAFKKWAKKYFDTSLTLFPAAYLDIETLLQEAIKINSGFRCYDDALQHILAEREKNERERIAAKNDLLKNAVSVKLFPYQQEGVQFAFKAGRSILADDMGLGKTVQAIAWANIMRLWMKVEKAVIICPTSLKYQWKMEIEKFTGGTVSATVVEGNLMTRMRCYENDSSFFKIISYHVAGNDWELINQMQPDIIILDEAQRIKNWKAKISQNIKRLQSPYALVLTGTPLENKIEELYSIVQFINPLLLGSLHNFLLKHQLTDGITGKVTGYKGLNDVGKQLSEILLRRTKKEVLKQLPERMDKNLFVPMTEMQSEMHEAYKDIVAKLVYKWRKMRFLSEQDRQKLMINLNLMRMVCNSTYIIDQETNHQTKLDELFNILDEVLQMPEEKVVIFSQWERMTRLVATELTARSIGYEYLHGGIESKKREKLFTGFNNDAACKIFLSTDAGGVGLNLQSAAYLINLDIPWNPAVLEQRIGRIYRMGQKKNVNIINLVAQNTIEHGMLARLKFKSSVAAGVLDNGEDCIFLGDDRFKQFMESVESITGSVVERVPEKQEDIEEEKTVTTAGTDSKESDTTPADNLINEAIDNIAANGKEQAANTTCAKQDSLVNSGINFFTQLVQTLSDKNATAELAKSITEKDEKTGKTYLKLPIENEDIITNGLNLLAGLLKKLS